MAKRSPQSVIDAVDKFDLSVLVPREGASWLCQKDRATFLRDFFRTWGLAGISVTCLRGAGCYQVVCRLPRPAGMSYQEWSGKHTKLRQIVETAFPDLASRSEPQWDHFDSVVYYG